jgi:hypothetical protein
MDSVVARKMLRTLEPYHGWIYFVREAHDAYAALGVIDRRMGYFGSRAAAMGPVPADVVIATFFNFYPGLVRSHVPKVWDITRPEALLRARIEAADAMLRRILGDATSSAEMREAAELARRAAEACTPEGRPLYAGHASLPWPDEPHLQLWHAQTLLREYRGDGHIAALVAAGLDAPEALITHGATGRPYATQPEKTLQVPVGMDVLKNSRAWPDDEWRAALERLRSRGWIDEENYFTDEGAAGRERIEQQTDDLAMRPWNVIGEDACTRLRELARPWSRAISASDAEMPMR